LEADERNRVVVKDESSQAADDPPSQDTARFLGPVGIKNMKELLDQMATQGSSKGSNEFGELLAKAGPLLDYMERQPEIAAASTELEAHRSEFEELTLDAERLGELAKTLFAEECFASLRFSAADVKRAFEQVGYPAMMSPDERTVETLRAAILHLADKDRRSELALKLLALMSEFVSRGRHQEAWLIQMSACETAEELNESNAFLFQMFVPGYDAWAAEKKAQDKSLMQELGFDLDRLASMSMDEMEEWLAAQASDPSKSKAMEVFFEEHPDLRAESVANLEALERGATKLLERKDCDFLLLSSQEVEPWLSRLNERFNEAQQRDGAPEAALCEENARRMFEQTLLPVVREMAESIFSRDRIRQLISKLKQFRGEKFAAGEKDVAATATGAINYLDREDQPGLNTFLITLCWASITPLIRGGAEETVSV
jgi:hypothetical protein